MIQRKGTNVYNKGKKIKEFEDEDDAESFANALSMMGEKKIIKENKVQRLYTSINEFKQYLYENIETDNQDDSIEGKKIIIDFFNNVDFVTTYFQSESNILINREIHVDEITYAPYKNDEITITLKNVWLNTEFRLEDVFYRGQYGTEFYSMESELMPTEDNSITNVIIDTNDQVYEFDMIFNKEFITLLNGKSKTSADYANDAIINFYMDKIDEIIKQAKYDSY